MATLENFRMPSEPCPLPSLGSEEESFVVLGKSLCDLVESSSIEDDCEPVGSSVVEDGRKLINSEIAAIDGLGLSEQQKPTADSSVANSSGMERSSVSFPKMPTVDRGLADSVNTISIATFSNDLSAEEVQTKIAEIIEENVHLKDTILQNNMSMKSQYERIVAWQEDVQKVHQAHKDKIYEAKDYIEKLKRDNEAKAFEIKKLNEILREKEEEFIGLKNNIKELECKSNESLLKSTDDNLKEFELDVAQRKVRELENELQNMTLQNSSLKVEKDQLIGDLKNIHAYDKTIEELRYQLKESKFQQEELQTQLAKAKYTVSEKESFLVAKVQQLQEQVQSLIQEKDGLPLPDELDKVKLQLASTQEQLMHIEQTRAMAYEQIGILNKTIQDLTKDNEQLRSRTGQEDEIYALQTQLEVYKADFEAERSAKETIKGENEKLTEDLQNLQRRNQQLQEEIEMIRVHHDYDVHPSLPRNTSGRSSASSNDHSLKCPKCNFGFQTFQALENHVNRCLELDDHLP